MTNAATASVIPEAQPGTVPAVSSVYAAVRNAVVATGGNWDDRIQPLVMTYLESLDEQGILDTIDLRDVLADMRRPVRAWCRLTGLPDIDTDPPPADEIDPDATVDENARRCLSRLLYDGDMETRLINILAETLIQYRTLRNIDDIIRMSGVLALVDVESPYIVRRDPEDWWFEPESYARGDGEPFPGVVRWPS